MIRKQKSWRTFLRENHHVIANTSIPMGMIESQTAFTYFLMHGTHPEYSYFSIRPSQILEIRGLVVAYLREFGDPGLVLFDTKTQAELMNRAGLAG